MEDPRKHDKKNTRIMPISINIGPGAGIGGLVLFGGSLVTATLVSALAFNTRRERRSSPDTISKSQSPPETVLTADASNPPESADSLPLTLQKPSDDEETIMKETQIKNIQDLTPDENHIAEQLECEEPVVMAADLESGPPSIEEDSGSEIIEREDDGEEQKEPMLNDDENDEHVNTVSLISDDKTVKSIQEHEAVEEAVQAEKSMAVAQSTDHVGEDEETVAASVNHVDVKDNPQLQNLEEEASKSEIKVAVNDDHQTTVKEDNPPTQMMNNKAEEEHKETEKMNKKDELKRKDEINHVESIEEEDEESSDDEGKRNSIEIEEEPTAEAKIRIEPKRRRSSVTMRLKNTWRRIKSLDIKRSEG